MFHRRVGVPGGQWITIFLVLGVAILSVPFFSSCEDESTRIGLEFKSVMGQSQPVYSDTFSIISSVETVDSVQTNDAVVGILGDFIDPVFGRNRSSFVSQFRLSASWDPGFNAEVDSMKVFFELGGYYGKATVKENINVYELLTDIYPDSAYYSDYDVSNHISEWPIGSTTFLPTDSVIEISLSKTYARRIIQDTAFLQRQDAFLEAFKGIYVDVDPVEGEGAFVNINLLSSNTYLAIYYHNDTGEDYVFPFYINAYTARINLFEHQYDEAPPETAIRFLNQGKEDTVIYVQGIGGVVTRLEIPGLKALRDSGDILINSAQMIIPLSPDDPWNMVSLYPNRLNLNVKGDDGLFYSINDLAFSENYFSGYFGGVLNSDSTGYTMNIARHIQDYLSGTNDYSTLYLNLRDPVNDPARAVLTSPVNSNPLRLELVYTKN